jgi:glycosyltransferase involved in cell wall biosynthesis
MKRVCFFCGDVGRSGGTERVATVIASNLAARGFDVSILSSSRGTSSFFPLHPAVQLHSLHMEGYSANFSDLRSVLRLRSFLKNEEIDCLVDVDTVASLVSIPAAWGLKTKVFSWEHFHFHINVGGWPQRLRRSLGRRLAARKAAAVITLTERDRQQYLNGVTCIAPVVTIPNPQTIAHSERSPLDKPVVLAAGRLTPQKGFDLLLKAWADIAQKIPEWKLRIVGSGQEEGMLKSMAHELGIDGQVDFVPNTTDMAREFLSASIFALSSRFEGLPLVLIEAKSFGLPIASFDCDCGPSEVIYHEKDGLLVAKEDCNALTSALRRLVGSRHDRETFGRAALQDKRFALSRIMSLWEELLGSVP